MSNKESTQTHYSRGFIQIPILFLIVFGVLVATGGGYYATTYKPRDAQQNTIVREENKTATTSGLSFASKIRQVTPLAPETVQQKPQGLGYKPIEPSEVQATPKETEQNFSALKAEILGYLEVDIKDLSALRENVAGDKERWATLSENVASQRAKSLDTLASGISNPDIRAFVEDTADHYWEDKAQARARLTDFYKVLQVAITERLGQTTNMRDEIAKGLAPEGFEKLLLGNESEILRLLNFGMKFNDTAYNMEMRRSDGYSDDLGRISTLISAYGVVVSTSQQLTQLEAEARKASIPKTEFRCRATTDYSGGINGSSETTVLCE